MSTKKATKQLPKKKTVRTVKRARAEQAGPLDFSSFGNRYAYLQSRSVPSYGRIARLTGLSQTHTMRVMKGENGVTLRTAMTIAAAAGVSMDRLCDHIFRGDKDLQKQLKAINEARLQVESVEAILKVTKRVKRIAARVDEVEKATKAALSVGA